MWNSYWHEITSLAWEIILKLSLVERWYECQCWCAICSPWAENTYVFYKCNNTILNVIIIRVKIKMCLENQSLHCLQEVHKCGWVFLMFVVFFCLVVCFICLFVCFLFGCVSFLFLFCLFVFLKVWWLLCTLNFCWKKFSRWKTKAA